MGNCIRVQPAPVSQPDDDNEWEWVEGNHRRRHFGGEFAMGEEGSGLLPKGQGAAAAAAAAATSTEMRIKISKRKLEELLRKVDVQDLPLHLVLAHLVSHSDRHGRTSMDRERHWQPALHSIPEVTE